MKRFIILAAGLLTSLSCFAAAGDTTGTGGVYHIADYQPPRFHTQSLYLSPGFNFGGNGQVDTIGQNGNKRKNNGIGGGFTIGSSHYLHQYSEMSDIEIATGGSISGNGSNQEVKTAVLEYSHSTYGSNVPYYISNTTRYRHYLPFGLFIEGKVFPSISHNPGTRYESENYTVNNAGYDTLRGQLSRYSIRKSTSILKGLSFNSGASASIGKGWVVDVTGAAVALQMLARIGYVNGSPLKLSPVRIDSLASVLDRSRWKRIFDSRIAEIETIDTLCQYLVKENILSRESARMTMELNDIFAYGFYQPRYTGYEINIAPVFEVYYNHYSEGRTDLAKDTVVPYNPAIQPQDLGRYQGFSTSRWDNNSSRSLILYGSRLTGKIAKLVSRDIEADGDIQLSATMNSLTDTSYTDSVQNGRYAETYPNAGLNLTAGAKWYPSIRSELSFSNQFMYFRDFNLTASDSRNNGNTASFSMQPGTLNFISLNSALHASYFLSPRCTFSFWVEASYYQGHNRSPGNYYYWGGWSGPERSWNVSFNSNVTYALF